MVIFDDPEPNMALCSTAAFIVTNYILMEEHISRGDDSKDSAESCTFTN